jgi:NitT/TauT family transport system substrate-binding protein
MNRRSASFQRSRISVRLLTGIAATLLLLGQSAGAEVVKLGQATATSLTFAPVYAAIKLGYFKAEDIEIESMNFQGASILLPQVANKTITIGFPGPDPLILSNQPGRDPLPLKFFYNAARESIWEFLVPTDSPIKTLADLKGKTIGVGALANANVPITRAMLKEIGLEMTRDYSFLPIGVGAPAFRATMNKEVDTYNTFDTNIAAFENTGAEFRRLPQESRYMALFSNGYVTHVDTIKEKPRLLAGFGRALAKGTIVCEVNPDFCVRNFYSYLPGLKPSGVSDEQALAMGRHILASRMKGYLAFPAGQPRRFGEYSEKSWKDFVAALYAGGELKSPDIDVSNLYTNEFVSEFNNFDLKSVEEQARQLN